MKKIFKDMKQFTFMSIMFALTLFFTFTIGVLPGSFASFAVLIFVPTIITSIIYGPLAGGFLGMLAGASTFLRAILMPLSVLDPLFINPLVSVLPRIIVGILPYYAYKLTMRLIKDESKKNTISSGVAGFVASISNTFFVMLMLYLLYAKQVVEAVGASFSTFLVSIIFTNALLEAAVTVIFTVVIMVAYNKIKQKEI